MPNPSSIARPGPARRTGSRHGASVSLCRRDGHVRTLGEIEEEVIRLALAVCGDSIPEVAARLRIGRSTLYRRLNRQHARDDRD